MRSFRELTLPGDVAGDPQKVRGAAERSGELSASAVLRHGSVTASSRILEPQEAAI